MSRTDIRARQQAIDKIIQAIPSSLAELDPVVEATEPKNPPIG